MRFTRIHFQIWNSSIFYSNFTKTLNDLSNKHSQLALSFCKRIKWFGFHHCVGIRGKLPQRIINVLIRLLLFSSNAFHGVTKWCAAITEQIRGKMEKSCCWPSIESFNHDGFHRTENAEESFFWPNDVVCWLSSAHFLFVVKCGFWVRFGSLCIQQIHWLRIQMITIDSHRTVSTANKLNVDSISNWNPSCVNTTT